ncbi:helix-turn-helix domain-containing protein [Streptococcus thermophilus]|jgi:putative transcriptional regulator|uniref:helix-turn-helix domain-containing protein n=1 Tax=Streptococcus thermophilus TaxID=1308 RepID=UPI000051164E|nr:helix-turn-helix transcriptional regulator [Streptococcus thermophilus]QBX11776.1 HTH DNA-binding protein [Streptococcus satellite phage Javan607]QBX11873.1 HTH DNA-binding protein [Streptococcus satellite phage Javan613]AKB97426.1 HTH DNA-binding protein [Streptococcus thermophilus]ASX19198.1 transcriptional regulator [Streptococcus thermophilus]MBW7804480.1 helix-turn-helix transcriptional regulator [Streptococcus thermophilus]
MRNNFRVILAKKRKTVADLSKDTGISKTTLTNLYYERTKNPDSQTLLKLSNALGVTIDEILTVEN